MRARRIQWLIAAPVLAGFMGACRPNPTPPAAPAPAAATATGVEHDICEGSPPLPHAPLAGILRNARCDQDMYYSMAQVADMLGVQCIYCHAAKVEGQPDRDFPAKTQKKEIANWMSSHLMEAVKPADGSRMRCASCHIDDQGRPVAKILGEPRDRVKANEWMNLVMVKKFVAADGSKLKCKSCHGGPPGTHDFNPSIILHAERLPRHTTAMKGTAGF